MERITELIQHPERLDRDTLYELRSVCALYPYYQTARLLMLQNLPRSHFRRRTAPCGHLYHRSPRAFQYD